MKSFPFTLDFLDHVAIRVADIETSALWYEKVLGMKRVQLEKWGAFPIFMVSKRMGVALFPAFHNDPEIPESKQAKIDHFAFHVKKVDYENAKKYFEQIKIDYNEQDHQYFLSIYLKDPDGHQVELTTLNQKESPF